MIKYIYGVSDIKKLDFDSKKYLEVRAEDFKKPFLNKDEKLSLTIKRLEKLPHDVLYFQ